MTLYCSRCTMNWSPHQCPNGCCPECGGGTVRRHGEPVSTDAIERHRAVLAVEIKRDRHARFETYCVERGQRETAALEVIGRLPTVDPPQRRAA